MTTTARLDRDDALTAIDDLIDEAIAMEIVGRNERAQDLLDAAVAISDGTCPPEWMSESVTAGHRRVVNRLFMLGLKRKMGVEA